MAKQFFDVFPSLKLEKKIQDLFEQVMVEKVSATKRGDYIRATVSCDYLIPKEMVFKVETEIKKQFFSGYNMQVKLYERFRLSGQYTPEKLMNVYKDSILLELRQHSPVEYHLFKGADIDFSGGEEIGLTIEDTVLGKSKAAELCRIMEKIFNDRCGFSVHCQIHYKEIKVREREEEVVKISYPAAASEAGEKSAETPKRPIAAGEPKAAKTAESGGSVSQFPGNGEKRGIRRGEFGKGNKGEFKRALKRSDNPDVIYGRDLRRRPFPLKT